MKNKRIAKLNPKENHAWEFAFCFHLEDGNSDAKADRLAWKDLQADFPRLKKYQGCR